MVREVGNPYHGKDGRFSSVDAAGKYTSNFDRSVGTRIEPIRNRKYSSGKPLINKGTKRTSEEHNTHFSKVVEGHIKKIQNTGPNRKPDVVFIDDSVTNFTNRKGYTLHGVRK
jgi:hypothetical protein